MTRRSWILAGVVLIELVSAIWPARNWWGSTRIPKPPLELYHDSQTAGEIGRLPSQYSVDSVEKWTTLADAYLAYGHYAHADACLEEAAQLRPKSREIAFQRGLCYERLGRLDKARAQFSFVADSSGGMLSSRAWYQLGRLALRSEDSAAADEAFRKSGPTHWAAVFQRAKLFTRAGDLTQAGPLVDSLFVQHPNDLQVLQLRASFARQSGDSVGERRARDRARRAGTTLALDDTELYLRPIRRRYGIVRQFGEAHEGLRQGTTREPAVELARGLVADPQWANGYLTVVQDAAELAILARDLPTARLLLDRQIAEQQFNSFKYWELRGDLAEAEGDLSGALAAYEQGAVLSPRRAPLQTKLSLTAGKLKRPQLQQQASRRALLLAGIELYLQNEIREAGPLFGQLAAEEPLWSQAWFYLGECERLRGDPLAARSAYSECLKLNRDHGRARDEMERILQEMESAKQR